MKEEGERMAVVKKLIRFDWALKHILRNKANFDVLEAFLSNLLNETIIIEAILESESNSDSDSAKFNRVDLKCQDGAGRHLIIEIQNQREADYLQRLLWGTSKAVVESIDLGQKYEGVVKVISISIVHHAFPKNDTRNMDFIYYGTTELKGIHNQSPLILQPNELLPEAHVTAKSIFPEYYLIITQRFEDMIQNDLDEWIYFFKHGEIKDTFKSPGILLAAKKLDYLTMKPEKKRAYEKYMSYLAQERSVLDTSKAEGIEIGIQKGRLEEKKSIARNLKLTGLDCATIAQVTGLSQEDIASL